MKRVPALGVIEFGDIPAGVYTTDAMLKRAPIAFVRSGTISRGRFLTVVGGTPAAVEESMAEGAYRGAGDILDRLVLRDVHPRVFDAILGERRPGGSGSLAIIETGTATGSIFAAEIALKAIPVELVEIRLADESLSGKGLALYRGELPDIEAVVDLVLAGFRERAGSISCRVVPDPHEALARQLGAGTGFGSAALLELEGEEA